MDLHDAVTVALVYLRRNLAQEAIGELFGISQPSVSRIIATLEGPIEAVLAGEAPTLADLPYQLVFVFDGTPTPCWSYHDHPELYSAKHHTHGPQPPRGLRRRYREAGLDLRPSTGLGP